MTMCSARAALLLTAAALLVAGCGSDSEEGEPPPPAVSDTSVTAPPRGDRGGGGGDGAARSSPEEGVPPSGDYRAEAERICQEASDRDAPGESPPGAAALRRYARQALPRSRSIANGLRELERPERRQTPEAAAFTRLVVGWAALTAVYDRTAAGARGTEAMIPQLEGQVARDAQTAGLEACVPGAG